MSHFLIAFYVPVNKKSDFHHKYSIFDLCPRGFHASWMSDANEITVTRHAAQKIMHWALTGSPQACQGLLAGHGHRIDDAVLLTAGQDGAIGAKTLRAAAQDLHTQGLAMIGWFHSRLDGHEPDRAMMATLEALGSLLPEPMPSAPIHLLAALDMKGRLDLHAYVHNHGEQPERAPLRLLDDTPLYLDAARR